MPVKKYVFFDFETSGIGNFKKQKAIQLAWTVADENLNIYGKPLSFYFNDAKKINTDFHKNLSIKKLNDIGINPKLILTYFLKDCYDIIKNDGLLIAHNISFDFQILKNECENQQIKFPFDILEKHLFCTMKSTTQICNLKSHNGLSKYPKLVELYQFLHNSLPELELHEASNDVEVLFRCFYSLSMNFKCIDNKYIRTN